VIAIIVAIVAMNTSQGSAYAAMMVTGPHGVRMQRHSPPGAHYLSAGSGRLADPSRPRVHARARVRVCHLRY
jgi:hypothetical protein